MKAQKRPSKKEQLDPLTDVYLKSMELCKTKNLNPHQLFMIGSYFQMAANEMAVTSAIQKFGSALEEHLSKNDEAKPKRTEVLAAREKSNKIVRVKPDEDV